MMRVLASFALVLAATALPVPPGVTSGLYSDLVAKSDFTLNLQPPGESAADVSDALDAVLKLEVQKNQAALAEFAAQKQQLLAAEKKEIAKLVASTFQAAARSSVSFIGRLEPAAALANQPVWQAGKPIPVTVSFDVPAYGPLDALATLQSASSVEAKLAQQASALGFLQKKAESSPSVEVSLAAPLKPLPAIAGAIGSLDAAREAFEAGKMAEVTAAFNSALRNAKNKIGSVMSEAFGARGAKAVSMLQGVVSFKVHVVPGAEPDASITSNINGIEHSRSDAEAKMFDAAAAEFEGITDVIVAALKKELSLRGSKSKLRGASAFLSLPEEASVKVVASDTPYPTVASLAADMETRRDISEGLAMARILELDMKLIKQELGMIKAFMAEL